MKDRADKQKQALLEQQQAADRARMDAFMQTAAAPKPLETTIDKESQEWIDATSGKNGPLDIRNLTAMKPNLALYDAASQRQQGERQGLGLLSMGAQNSNPMLGQLLRSQQDDQRQQDASGQLENAYRITDAQKRGNIFPLLGLQQSRTMGLANMASGNSQNSTAQYANFRPAPSIWQQMLLAGISGGSQIASSFAGRK